MSISWEYTANDIKVSHILSTEFNGDIPENLCNVGTSSPYYTNYIKSTNTEQINGTNTPIKNGCSDYTLKIPVTSMSNVRLYSTCILGFDSSHGYPNTWTPNSNVATQFRLIDFDVQKYYISFTRLNSSYTTGFVGELKKFSDDSNATINGHYIYISPMLLFDDSDTGTHIYYYPYKPVNKNFFIYGATTHDTDRTYNHMEYSNAFTHTHNNTEISYACMPYSIDYNHFDITYTDNHFIKSDSHYITDFEKRTTSPHGKMSINFSDTNADKILIASLGYYFEYNNVKYMPIITNGITDGTYVLYSQKDQYKSDIKKRTSTIDGNPIFPSPLDELDDIGLTLNANGNSFINYYACTASNLTALLDWCNRQTEFNGIDWIIGVKQAPCNIPSISSTESTHIHLKGIDTGVDGYSLKNQGDSSTTSIQSYQINHIHGNFLDYEPYTHIDLYIPYCGTVSLPPSLFMGRTLKTEMIYDIFSGECSCAVFADNTFYTSIGGVFMTQQAVTAEQMGSIHNAVVNGAMSIIGGGISTVAGAVAGNPLMSVGGAVSMLGGAVKSYQTINSISPEVRGNSGGRCNFYKPDNYTLMITTPNNITDSDFKKYNGYISNKTLTLSQNMGYTVINNPVITGDMTQSEKQEIDNYMKSGIIL